MSKITPEAKIWGINMDFERRVNARQLIIVAIAFFYTYSPVFSFAETVSNINIPVYFASSGPVGEHLLGQIVDSTGAPIVTGNTDGSGVLVLNQVEEGEYKLEIKPTQSASCIGCGQYKNKELTIVVSKSSDDYDADTETLTLDTVQLEQASRVLKVSVIEGAIAGNAAVSGTGSPIAGLFVNIFNAGGEVGTATTDAYGYAYFAIEESSKYLWNVTAYSFSGGYTQPYLSEVSVAEEGETTVVLEAIPTNSTIILNLKKSGSTYAVPGDSYGSANCTYFSDTTQYAFSAQLNPSDTSASVGVVSLGSGTYQCSVWIPNTGSSSVSVSVEADQTVSQDILVLEKDAAITVRLVNQDGDLITDLNAHVFASTDNESPVQDYSSTTESAGIASLFGVDGAIYNITVNFEDGSSKLGKASKGVISTASGTRYINTFKPIKVTASTNSPQSVEYTINEADATLKVEVKDSSGDPSVNAWVNAYEENVNADDSSYTFVGGATDENGKVSLPLIGGKSYIVSAYPEGSFSGKTIPPPQEIVFVAKNKTKSITLESFKANHKLTITPVAVSAASRIRSTPDYVDCYGRSDGIVTYANSGADTVVSLQLIKGKSWVVGCFGYNSELGTFFNSDEIGYEAKGTSGSSRITLAESGAYYPPQSYTFSCTTTNTIVLPDGESTLTVPAESIGSTGNCTITVGTASGLTADDDQYPAYALDFSAFDSLGNQITDFSTNLTLVMHYNEEDLPVGMNEDSLGASFFDSETHSWQQPDSVEIDTDSNTVTISLSHFSSYGITGEVEALAAPTKLTIAKGKASCKRGAKSQTISWRKVRGAKTYEYQIRKRVTKADKNKSVDERFNEISWEDSKLTKAELCLAKGSYEYRVRAVTRTKVPGLESNTKNVQVK